MQFKILYPASAVSNANLIYVEEDQSFDTEPPMFGASSLLINTLSLELDQHGKVISAWGLCSSSSWKVTQLNLPSAQFADVFYVSEKKRTSGVSIPLSGNKFWPSFVDYQIGWVMLGDTANGNNVAKITNNIILEFNRELNLVGVWLKPESLPAQ